MTDKEILNKLIAEIEWLEGKAKTTELDAEYILAHLLDLVDNMQKTT